MTAFVYLKTFFAPRGSVSSILPLSVLPLSNMKCRQEISFNLLIATLFHSTFVRKSCFTVKIFNMFKIICNIISVGLTCMSMYPEAYLESSKTSTVKHLCENNKKTSL